MEITYKDRTYIISTQPEPTCSIEAGCQWQEATEAKADAIDKASGEQVELYFRDGRLYGIIHDEFVWAGPICEKCE